MFSNFAISFSFTNSDLIGPYQTQVKAKRCHIQNQAVFQALFVDFGKFIVMVITKKYDWEQKLPYLGASEKYQEKFIIPEQTLIIEKNVKFSMYLSWVKYTTIGHGTSARFQVKPIEGVNISSTVLEYSMTSPNGEIKGTISNLEYDKEKNIHYSSFEINERSKTFFSIFNGKNSKEGTIVTYSLTVEVLLTDMPILVEEFSKLPALLFADKELCDVKIICNGKKI